MGLNCKFALTRVWLGNVWLGVYLKIGIFFWVGGGNGEVVEFSELSNCSTFWTFFDIFDVPLFKQFVRTREPLGAIPYYDFNFQNPQLQNRTILPGDNLIHECVFTNPLNSTLYGGESTEQEMCFNFISVMKTKARGRFFLFFLFFYFLKFWFFRNNLTI